ncbi:unnamed protein product [Gongylonema pulchrum]|uniref:Uncharacterized protein n=1 Tax=Gongylonema pulchrum TaxID=637853 RepID=A0A3P6PBC5_9BILA|nr:unnamed protein product [Gongylonema pulchrum]
MKEKWWKKGAGQCDKLKTDARDLENYSLYGIFLFLLIGLILSILCAVLEFCIKAVQENREKKVSLWLVMKKRLLHKLGCFTDSNTTTETEHLEVALATVMDSHYENKMANKI